jgi:Root hair defective 3 GTP-binding protein (RHD3)
MRSWRVCISTLPSLLSWWSCARLLTLAPHATVLRNPVYFIFLILLAAGAYVTYTLNLWGPMINMANAASSQALDEGKKRLREFLEASDTGRQAMKMSTADGRDGAGYEMNRMNGAGYEMNRMNGRNGRNGRRRAEMGSEDEGMGDGGDDI